MSSALTGLQKRLDCQFSDPELLQTALTHRSFSADHYERLEFLGDAVLDLSISTMLFQQLQGLPEGDLSRIRANLVRQETLHQIGTELGLPACLRLGEGEARSGGKSRPSILADAVEAIIGAVYLDQGFDAAAKLVRRLYQGFDISPHMQAMGKDPKTELQEWLQARKLKVPSYSVVATLGAAHRQNFEVECQIEELQLSLRGSGSTRRAAEQSAAASMLKLIQSKAMS